MKPLQFRFSIATLAVVVAVVAIDIVWFRTILRTHRSALGFAAEGYDSGLFLMAHVLPFGLYPMIHRRGAANDSWSGSRSADWPRPSAMPVSPG